MKASTLIENAACASQNRELLEGGKLYDHVLRNVFDPMQSRITALEAERDRRGLPALDAWGKVGSAGFANQDGLKRVSAIRMADEARKLRKDLTK